MEDPTLNIPGLTYVEDFISPEEERALLAAVDASPWLHDLRRRVQHYGYRYDYRQRSVNPAMRLGPLPKWAEPLAQRLAEQGRMPRSPDQMIVNEYEPGEGIGPHVDCVPCFGPVICSVTLGSHAAMEFTEVEGEGRASLLLRPRGLLVLAGDARYQWRHAIAGRRTDLVDGRAEPRGRRISLTFRTVLPAV